MMAQPNILIVDDEASIRHFLKRILERAGYEVLSADSGSEALNLLESQHIDLLLTDIRMDRMSGVTLLEQVRKTYPEMAVILLTGHATVETAVAALRQGATNYLLKPVKNEELLEAIKTGLQVQLREQRRDQLEQLATHFSAVIAREDGFVAPDSSSTEVKCGTLTLHRNSYVAYLSGKRLALTPTEFRLLLTFAQSPGETMTYVDLVRDACGYACQRQEAQEIIGTHIRNLRQKLGISPQLPLYIESIRGIGYRLLPQTPAKN
jgi:DNA-binding response OmpR family regulator